MNVYIAKKDCGNDGDIVFDIYDSHEKAYARIKKEAEEYASERDRAVNSLNAGTHGLTIIQYNGEDTIQLGTKKMMWHDCYTISEYVVL